MGARFWLIKSEPAAYSWDDLVKDGETLWDGVRNHRAAMNLRAMAKGDRAFFYHSVTGKEIVGVAEIIREAYPDPTDATGKFVCVDIKALKALPRPVSLAAIKGEKRLENMALLKQSRLSVQPVTAAEWALIETMGGR